MQREKRNKVGSRAAEESFVETALGKREVEAKDKYSLGFFYGAFRSASDRLRLQLRGAMEPGILY